jgi:hypothetical protein
MSAGCQSLNIPSDRDILFPDTLLGFIRPSGSCFVDLLIDYTFLTSN